jgi:hypothetical protein
LNLNWQDLGCDFEEGFVKLAERDMDVSTFNDVKRVGAEGPKQGGTHKIKGTSFRLCAQNVRNRNARSARFAKFLYPRIEEMSRTASAALQNGMREENDE